jgi:hypothetical protein
MGAVILSPSRSWGAPPQLEQQVQVFNSYFRGNAGSGYVPSAELAYIASPHLGLVATVPFQIGFGGQTTGFEDAQLLVQWLAAGSLELDNMLSVGAMGTFPIGRGDLSSGDYYVGPFVYGAQRFFPPPDLRGQRDHPPAYRSRRLDPADPRNGARRGPAHAGALLLSRLRAGGGEQHDVSGRDGRVAPRAP